MSSCRSQDLHHGSEFQIYLCSQTNLFEDHPLLCILLDQNSKQRFCYKSCYFVEDYPLCILLWFVLEKFIIVCYHYHSHHVCMEMFGKALNLQSPLILVDVYTFTACSRKFKFRAEKPCKIYQTALTRQFSPHTLAPTATCDSLVRHFWKPNHVISDIFTKSGL